MTLTVLGLTCWQVLLAARRLLDNTEDMAMWDKRDARLHALIGTRYIQWHVKELLSVVQNRSDSETLDALNEMIEMVGEAWWNCRWCAWLVLEKHPWWCRQHCSQSYHWWCLLGFKWNICFGVFANCYQGLSVVDASWRFTWVQPDSELKPLDVFNRLSVTQRRSVDVSIYTQLMLHCCTNQSASVAFQMFTRMLFMVAPISDASQTKLNRKGDLMAKYLELLALFDLVLDPIFHPFGSFIS